MRIGSRPTLDMLADRIRARGAAPPRNELLTVELITAGRDEHDAALAQRIAVVVDSAYDAPYVALAEALNAELLTCDERLARTVGHSARIVAV